MMPWWGWLLTAALVMLGIFWGVILVIMYKASHRVDEVWNWQDPPPDWSPTSKRRL